MGIRKGNKLDVAENKIEITNYCPTHISRVYTQEGLNQNSFDIADLSSIKKIQLHIRAYVDFYGGYSEHGRYVTLGLNDSGECCVKLTPIKSLVDIDPFLHQKCNFLVNNPAFKIDESIFLTIAGPGWAQEKFQPKSRYKIIWTMIESLNRHPDFDKWFEDVDEVWAPTTCDVRRFDGIKPKVVMMPLGVDDNIYNPCVKPINIHNVKGRFVFGVLGSWNKRKGIKKIVRAFCRAFKSTDNVSLLLVCKYGTRPYDGWKDGEKVTKDDKEKWDIKYEFDRYTKDLKPLPHVSIIDVPIHENIMPNVLKRFDCLVGFSMGESTWLPGVQAMMMKIPVIQLANPCCGFMDYMGENNSFLCRHYDLVEAGDELVKGTSEYYEDQEFADGNEDELIEKMLKVYKDYYKIGSEEINLKIERARPDVLQVWTQRNSLQNVIIRLKEIKNGNTTV